ncbi:MAG: proline dehydrogenase family protein [Bacteroidetes bacterium]|nr:proline dehydrogenase family protein [Bacteroidota bacterium]
MSNKTIDFSNTETAYSIKSNSELKLAQVMFSVLQSKALSQAGRGLLKFSINAHLPVKGIIKATLFKHFIGGESINDTKKVMERLAEFNVHSILDYSLEGIEKEADFDAAVEEFKANVMVAAEREEVPFSVFKPSAIATHKILEKVTAGANLSEAETAEFERVRNRFHAIFKLAHQKGVRVMIDAEESWIQGAIDQLAEEMMIAYNKEQVIAMNTFQMYRHDRLNYLKQSYQKAQENGVKLGAKLVRGAYMEKERERAEEKGYPSPINATKQDSDNSYNSGVEFCLNHIDNLELFIGTHNEKSVQLAVNEMTKLGLDANDSRVWFSQLYGMCDHITFNIAKHGYNVAKYVPYGPVKAVIPYLLRRADENSSVAGQAAYELQLLKSELKRRK